ncbi:MAG: phosphatidylglycerophosphatase A [Sulfuritalea sp.]|nr:phosphatidylglycerophosphatase A [Sulfuritalea sp.]
MSEPETLFPTDAASSTFAARPTARFMRGDVAHWIALGFGSGLSRVAPGTVGTLWAWIAFIALTPWMNDLRWAALIAVSLPVGWWACSRTARHMGVLDPGSIVWDEIVAFWLVLWLVMPTGVWGQLFAFALFRFFDAVKPGPVGWADRLFHRTDPTSDRWAWVKAGAGIMLDDLVAALCTLLVIAVWRWM